MNARAMQGEIKRLRSTIRLISNGAEGVENLTDRRLVAAAASQAADGHKVRCFLVPHYRLAGRSVQVVQVTSKHDSSCAWLLLPGQKRLLYIEYVNRDHGGPARVGSGNLGPGACWCDDWDGSDSKSAYDDAPWGSRAVFFTGQVMWPPCVAKGCGDPSRRRSSVLCARHHRLHRQGKRLALDSDAMSYRAECWLAFSPEERAALRDS